ncbi:iron chaperone [Streptomyces sp. NPDC021224]|uniref:iron chaperone n=1 Tax=unclassified Streptomyces TaxID=2593676 RepID=UPI0037AE518A
MATGKNSTHEGFTAEERAAMKDHAQELKAAGRSGSAADKAAQARQDVLAKIAGMRDSDRIMAERVHAVVTAAAPALAPKLWYGMPAYALDGKIVCFFQSAEKFKARYATLGFSDQAKLDDGTMWAAGFALTEVTPETEARIAELVKRAVG